MVPIPAMVNIHGLNAPYEVDVASQSLVKVTNMAHGRWYPTCVTLRNGQVFVVNGFDEYGVRIRLVEMLLSSLRLMDNKV